MMFSDNHPLAQKDFYDTMDVKPRKIMYLDGSSSLNDVKLLSRGVPFPWNSGQVDDFWRQLKYLEPCQELAIKFIHTKELFLEEEAVHRSFAGEIRQKIEATGMSADLEENLKFSSIGNLEEAAKKMFRGTSKKLFCLVLYFGAGEVQLVSRVAEKN
ncbi:unnamed protein product [Caenorhabditis auriculariae]|uniref:Uncharacterized protein n=1 Tax=Caenorhabditis auriculariae TaxID=2777116 RepID=A0A8S1HHI1_9PELO|nr:unnamed protein product [Caenorhabditis auriculariae]